MKLNKKAQIEQRRALILELYSQGMTQQQISDVLKPDVLKISQAVVSRDLEYLHNNSIEYVKRNRRLMAEEYQTTYVNLKTLRRDIFEYYRKAKQDNDVRLVMELVPIIEDIEQSIHNVVSAGHHVEAELLHYGQQQNKKLEERLEKTLAHAKVKH